MPKDMIRYLFNEVTDDRIVEVVDVDPLDSLVDVLLLFLLQRQLNEDLLELLVTVVNDELLKTIVLKRQIILHVRYA